MNELERDIMRLEERLATLLRVIDELGGTAPPSILQNKAETEAALERKRQELDAQQRETVYEHLSRIVGYTPELKTCIEETVDKLLQTNIPNGTDPGLLLGKIQCGKTRAFVGVMGLAFDRGIDVCIVLTKSDNGLVSQTLARMEYEFRDYLTEVSTNQTCVIGVHEVERDMLFNQAQIDGQKNIFIAHKNVTRLNYLIALFSNTEFRNKRVLIVDDEADFVSRAFYQRNGDVDAGKIAMLIDRLVRTPVFCRYLQVTATPYSLFLQPDHMVQVNNGIVEPFRPRFTTLVPIHKDYVGGKQYFIKSQNSASMYSYLKHIVSDECITSLLYNNRHARVYNNAHTTPRYADLRNSLMSYFVASAIRELQEEKLHQRVYNSSFFMHISTTTKDHRFEKLVVDKILDAWRDYVMNNQTQDILQDFSNAYEDLNASNEAGNQMNEIDLFMPTYQEVLTRFNDILTQESYAVQMVNNQTTANLLGRDGQLRLTSRLNIFIGGFRLDRGITIDHLLGFMYGRNPQTSQSDTVLQHHRMYGNRSKEDMSVTRLHTTQRLYSTMEWIDNMDHQLREVFVRAMQNPNAPMPAIAIQFDRQLGIRPCARNRLLISDLETFDSFKRFTPSGFQTDCATRINPIVAGIDAELQNTTGYQVGTPFLISKDVVYEILRKIRSTYIYNRPIDHNAGLEWDENLMIAAIEKYIPQDNKVWCYVVEGRNMSRVRQNGNFVDAPEDGNKDTPIARQHTQGANAHPFLMLFKERGTQAKGWRDAEFYWPCLRLPQQIQPCVFCK